jgi:K+-sensing histidine kinase KdpD
MMVSQYHLATSPSAAVLTVIIDRACIAVQGHYGAVGIIERQMLEVAKATHSLLDDDSYYASLPLDRSSAMSDAVLSQAPVWIQSQAEYIERYPAYTDGAKTINLQALAALPLRINEQISGSIMIGFPQPQTIVEEDRRFLMTLADYCAQAIERARLYEAERQARQEAETANKLKLQFLGMISHELRTPLTSIKGFATTLLAPDVTFDAPTQREFIGIMDTESDRLAGLIDQLLDLTRLQAGSLPIHRKVQPFDTVLRLAKVRLDILTRNHPLVIDLPPDLPLLLVDGERIAQVLVNLVGNSVKFSPPGSCITVTAGMLEGQVLITVHDQGIGIPVEAREYIFEAFRQIEREKPHEIKGAGLGLAICKGLIDAHGGRIWVRHHDGGGAVICFTLPPAAG